MRTTVDGVYAVGDAAESYSLITGAPLWRPLGSTANKMGRIAGDAITGGNLTHRGILGTGIVRVFELAVGHTGLSETEARAQGFDVEVIHNIKPAHATYIGGRELTIKAIADRGAGKESTDARFAPSLELLRGVVKKGVSLNDMFERIVMGTESGLWEPWLAAFGIELRGVSYGKTEPRNARLALDISLGAKANPLFANAGIRNWRSLVAEDCAQLQVEKPTEHAPAKAYAIFYLETGD